MNRTSTSDPLTPKRQLNFYRIFVITAIGAQIAIYGLLWVQMMSDQALRTGSDFMGFFAAARITQTKGAEYVYLVEEQYLIETEQVGRELPTTQVLLFNHLPYLFPILKIIVNQDYVQSFIRWGIILLIFNALNVSLLVNAIKGDSFLRSDVLILAIGTFLFFPVFTSIMNGQDTIFILLGAILWLTGLTSKKYPLAGIGLGIMTMRPQLALFLAIPFLFKERKVWWWFMITSLLLLWFTILLLGVDGFKNLINFLLVTGSGDWYGFHEEDMLNITGFLQRLIPELGNQIIHLIAWSFYLLAILCLCIIWFRSTTITLKHLGIAVTASLFFAPYLHYHELSLLLISIFCLMGLLQTNSRANPKYLALFPMVTSLILILSFSRFNFVKYSIPYLVMFSLSYFIWRPEHFIKWIEKVRFLKQRI